MCFKMSVATENICGTNDLAYSNTRLTDNVNNSWKEKPKRVLKLIKKLYKNTTVEPCLFLYMMCISLSALAVQNMHLEKACRVNYRFGDEICDRLSDRNSTGLKDEEIKVHSLVANVVAWKFPLQTVLPAIAVLFVGAWSDKTKKRKICILFPILGEMVSNVGLLLATYYFYELSLNATAVIETIPAALTGSYIIIFMGMYSYMTDITTIENRTFRLGIVAIFVNLGTPAGTVLSGILLKVLGYYGMFSLLLGLHTISLIFGILKLEDVKLEDNNTDNNVREKTTCLKNILELVHLVIKTIMVALKPRAFKGRTIVLSVLVLYIIMVGPLYGDSQVAYLYAIRRFSFTAVEYSIYGTFGTILGLLGTLFCITVLSKWLNVQDSVIGAVAGVSRIAACFVFAFAPTRHWYYSAPIFNIFSHTGLTAVRSIATKSVGTDEVAKLSSIMGLMEGIASSIYNPISSSIYTETIETFPGAFYMFDAALTVIALGLFTSIYIIVAKAMKEKTKADTEAATKENLAYTNTEHT